MSDEEYINWKTSMDKDYSNFMELTSGPRNNPFGLTGNPDAMKYLESNKPERPTTVNNPFMNIPITDYNIPQKYSKAGKCDEKCKSNFYKNLFRSVDDAIWNRQSSERQFYTTSNTSIPNEQIKFAQWLYGKNEVGKTGSIYDRYGYPYTVDSLVNTGNNSSSPENAGQVENNFGIPVVSGTSPWVNNINYGYGFGGVPGGVPSPNNAYGPPSMVLYPMPLFPVFPYPVNHHNQRYQTIPPGLPSGLPSERNQHR